MIEFTKDELTEIKDMVQEDFRRFLIKGMLDGDDDQYNNYCQKYPLRKTIFQKIMGIEK